MKDKSGKSRRKKTKAKKPKPKDKDVPEDQSPDENDESQTPDHSEVGNETDKTSPGPITETHTDESKTTRHPTQRNPIQQNRTPKNLPFHHQNESNPAKYPNQHNPVLGVARTLMRLHGVLWCPRRGFCPWRLPGGCISLRHGHDHGTQHRPTGAIEPEHRRRTGLAAAGDLPRHTVPSLRVRIRHVRLRVHSHVRTFAPSFGLHRRRGSRRPRRRMVRQQAVHRGGRLVDLPI